MAQLIRGASGRWIYPAVVELVKMHGHRVLTRNGDARNLEDVTIELETPVGALPLAVGRKLSTKIAAAEALQLIGGFSDPAWLCKIAPQFERFREDITSEDDRDGRDPLIIPWFHGAYGNRISSHDQLRVIVDRLRTHPETRQAVVTLWNPAYDAEEGHLDYPCTVALGFSIRLGTLNMRVAMRSNDVWLGLPYDIFQFTQLQLTLCNVLNLKPGRYVHTAWSLHLYESDVEKADEVINHLSSYSVPATPRGIGRRDMPITDVQTLARSLAFHPGDLDDALLTVCERWYRDVWSR